MVRRPHWSQLPLAAMLAEYGLRLDRWEEVSSCLKIETDQGLFRLKCFAYPASEFPFVYTLVQYLAQQGFRHPEMMRVTLRGQLGLPVADQFFYLASWQEGMTGFPLGRDALLKVGNLVGSLHQASQGFQPRTPVHSARSQWGIWPTKLMARYQDLLKFTRLAEAGVTAFDRLFASQAPAFITAAQRALLGLEELSCYQEIVNNDKQAHYVCHRDCIPRNIVTGLDGELILIDFDNAAYAERVDDIAKLLSYFSGWRLENATTIFTGYSNWFPLREEEIQLIQTFLEFPMEYWRLGRLAYERNHARYAALRNWTATSSRKAEFVINLERVTS